jgi:hypothetical protein
MCLQGTRLELLPLVRHVNDIHFFENLVLGTVCASGASVHATILQIRAAYRGASAIKSSLRFVGGGGFVLSNGVVLRESETS